VKRVATLTLLLGVLAGLVLYVQAAEPSWYYRLRYPLAYDSIIRGHAENYRLDAALLAGVIYQESKFDPEARSDAGAVGLMQLRPDTARGIALRTGGSKFQVDDLTNPELNVRYGSWYLRHLLDKYDDERLALAAFNAGQGNVDSWREQGKGIAFAETRAYVDRVEELRGIYRDAYASELGY
jgi:soluble lytic murein transglycosylase